MLLQGLLAVEELGAVVYVAFEKHPVYSVDTTTSSVYFIDIYLIL